MGTGKSAIAGRGGVRVPQESKPPRRHRKQALTYSTTAVDRRSSLRRLHPPGRTDKNLCRCFGAPARRVFPVIT
jgi:hypothetical protein